MRAEVNDVNGTTRLDRSRLAKVLSMLQSSHPGEVVAAANRAVSMLRDAGLGFDDLVAAAGPLEPAARQRPRDRAHSDRAHSDRAHAAAAADHEATIACLRALVAEHEEWRSRATGRIALLEQERRQQEAHLERLAAEAEAVRYRLAVAEEEAGHLRLRVGELEAENERLRHLLEQRGGEGPAWRHNADKRAAVLLLLSDPTTAELSDREIARRAGVSPQTVGNIRREENRPAPLPAERKVIRNGRVYTMRVARIGKKPRTPPPASHAGA